MIRRYQMPTSLLLLLFVVTSAAAQTLTLRITDPDGAPLPYVQVGRYMDWSYPEFPGYYLGSMSEIPPTTDEDGVVVLDIAKVFFEGEESPEETRIYFQDPINGLAGAIDVNKSAFGGDETIILSAPVEVSGRITVDEGALTWASMGILSGEKLIGTIGVTKDYTFSLQLPPGTYGLRAYGGGENGPQLERVQPIVVEEDAPVSLSIELEGKSAEAMNAQPSDFLENQKSLVGQVAPEFANIRGWMNTEALTLESLRGKAVLLDFWGYWCGPCVYSMPRLMTIHDTFAEHGLVVIGIHEAGSLESIDMLPEMVKNSQETVWGNRAIPFALALDGGTAPSGDTTQAYGVVGFPTSYLIDRDGKVHSTFHPSSPDAWSEVCELVGVDIPEPQVKAAPAKPSSIDEPIAAGKTMAEWEQAAAGMYTFQEGWAIRYVYPPFVSARNDMIRARFPSLDLDALGAPDMLILRHDEGTTENFPVAAYGYLDELPLRSVMEVVLGIEPWAIAGDEALLDVDMMGDWIIDASRDEAGRVDTFAAYGREMLGLDMEIARETAEVDVLVVTLPTGTADGEQRVIAQRLHRATGLAIRIALDGEGDVGGDVRIPSRADEELGTYVERLSEAADWELNVAREPVARWVVRKPE